MQGAFERALQLQDRIAPLHDAMFIEASPAPVKFAASLLGLSTDEVRLPLVPATEGARTKIRRAMEQSGIVRG
jgi:4-hydroxy-tetrahydrodipicolinate synthase